MAQAQPRRVHIETLEALSSNLGVQYIDVESFIQSVQIEPDLAKATFRRAEREGVIEPVDESVYRIC